MDTTDHFTRMHACRVKTEGPFTHFFTATLAVKNIDTATSLEAPHVHLSLGAS